MNGSSFSSSSSSAYSLSAITRSLFDLFQPGLSSSQLETPSISQSCAQATRTIQIINLAEYHYHSASSSFSSSFPSSSSMEMKEDFMKLFMRKIHYLLPITVTAYHLTSFKSWRSLFQSTAAASSSSSSSWFFSPSGAIQPFFRGLSELIDLESSPVDCRGRKHFKVDPSTRIERIPFQSSISRIPAAHAISSSSLSQYSFLPPVVSGDFQYRRIGDPRLTFLQYDYDPSVLLTPLEEIPKIVPAVSLSPQATTTGSPSKKILSLSSMNSLWDLLTETVSALASIFFDRHSD